jgi:hypothetical protein
LRVRRKHRGHYDSHQAGSALDESVIDDLLVDSTPDRFHIASSNEINSLESRQAK